MLIRQKTGGVVPAGFRPLSTNAADAKAGSESGLCTEPPRPGKMGESRLTSESKTQPDSSRGRLE